MNALIPLSFNDQLVLGNLHRIVYCSAGPDEAFCLAANVGLVGIALVFQPALFRVTRPNPDITGLLAWRADEIVAAPLALFGRGLGVGRTPLYSCMCRRIQTQYIALVENEIGSFKKNMATIMTTRVTIHTISPKFGAWHDHILKLW